MKKFLMVGVGGALLFSLLWIPIKQDLFASFIEMEVKGVRMDMMGHSPVIILADKEGKKALPIWIGLPEANAIDMELNHISSPRPMTHDLLLSILSQARIKVKEVKIVQLKNYTYYASLFLLLNKDQLEIDARPSDAIILALKSKAPIFVSTQILEEQGIVLQKKEAFGERYGIRIQELTPALASHFNFKGENGVLVSEVIPGSPSEISGIKAGDIIVKINLKEVKSVQEFEKLMDSIKEVSPVKILIFRDDQYREVRLQIKP
ncbi:MAG: bifunctional nuclease domain-containing protein [Thermodesulfobacteriota bacterium]